MSSAKVSRAMTEVWELKAEIDREYAHWPADEQVKRRLADAAKIAARLGFKYAPSKRKPAALVAEHKAKYGKK